MYTVLLAIYFCIYMRNAVDYALDPVQQSPEVPSRMDVHAPQRRPVSPERRGDEGYVLELGTEAGQTWILGEILESEQWISRLDRNAEPTWRADQD